MFIRYENIKEKENPFIYILSLITFLGYSILMFFEVFIGPYRTYSHHRRYNFHPFKTIESFILYGRKYHAEVVLLNLVANVVAFIPLGVFMPLLFHSFRSFKRAAFFYLLIITGIEGLQFIFNVGVCDIDDIILNTIGCIIGYVFYLFIAKLRTGGDYIE